MALMKSGQSRMLSSCPEFHQKSSFHIKHDDLFFSRFLSKETSIANPSFRVYYGDVSCAVPFTWESRPGTPKYTFSDTSLPALTPPPSYSFHTSKKTTNKHPRSKLLRTLLMRMNIKKAPLPTSPSSSSLSSLSRSSSHSSFSCATTASNFLARRRFSSRESSFDDWWSDNREMSYGTLKAGFCFGTRRKMSAGIRGANSVVTVKKTLLSILGRESD